jgi:uncharacterized membrane protein
MQVKKTFGDRVMHALLFETIALVICSPMLAWAMGRPLFDAGVLVLAVALVAMAWNMLYNALFDRVEARAKLSRTPLVRVFHAIGFEIGLIAAVVPLAAWWFAISYWDAFVLEIGLILFFLPYTYVFNLVYDRVRERKYALATL